jgi:prepilin-type N-terminal cleavage/methylation domain-containing protein
MKAHPKAFTLIEILLVAALFAMLGLAAFTCLSNGLKLWQRAGGLASEEDVAMFLDRFCSDAKNAFSFSQISFEGEEMKVAFPTLVWTATDRRSVRANDEYETQMGRVEYGFDMDKKAIVRRQANYSQALREEWSDPQIVVANVEHVRFRYFYEGQKEGGPSASGLQLPSAVEIEIGLIQAPNVSSRRGSVLLVEDGAQGRVFRRFVMLPSGA